MMEGCPPEADPPSAESVEVMQQLSIGIVNDLNRNPKSKI